MDGQATVQRRVPTRTEPGRPQHETDRSRGLDITMQQHHARKRDHTSPANMRDNEREGKTATPQPSRTPCDHPGPGSARGRLDDKPSAPIDSSPRLVHDAFGHLAPCESSSSRTTQTSRGASRPTVKRDLLVELVASTIGNLCKPKEHIA